MRAQPFRRRLGGTTGGILGGGGTIGKGWTRRPSAVNRAAFDEAFARTFSENGAVVEENGIAPPCGDVLIGAMDVVIDGRRVSVPIYVDPSGGIASVPEEPAPRKRRPAPDGCEIASVMTEGFPDQRGSA